jgi:hypothetical protein
LVYRKSHVIPQNVIKQCCSLRMVCCECSYKEWSHFFPETVNSRQYGTHILTAFVQHLSNYESTCAFLLQDSGTSHAKISLLLQNRGSPSSFDAYDIIYTSLVLLNHLYLILSKYLTKFLI